MPIINHFPSQDSAAFRFKKTFTKSNFESAAIQNLINAYNKDSNDRELKETDRQFLNDIISILDALKEFRLRTKEREAGSYDVNKVANELDRYELLKARYSISGTAQQKEIILAAIAYSKESLFKRAERFDRTANILKVLNDNFPPAIYLAPGKNIRHARGLSGGAFGQATRYELSDYQDRIRFEKLNLLYPSQAQQNSAAEQSSRQIVVKTVKKIDFIKFDPNLTTEQKREMKARYQQAVDNLPNEIAINEAIRKAEIAAGKPCHCSISTRAYIGNELALVSRYEENGDLKNYLGKLYANAGPEERMELAIKSGQAALDDFERITKGLQFMHKAGILHNDIALRNILVNANGEALLSDFGLAVKYDTTNPKEPVSVNSSQVPIRWLSSAALATRKRSQASDAYALKITFLQILAERTGIKDFTTGRDLSDSIVSLKYPNTNVEIVNHADFIRVQQSIGDDKTLEEIKNNLLNGIDNHSGILLDRLTWANNNNRPDNEIQSLNFEIKRISILKETIENILTNNALFTHQPKSPAFDLELLILAIDDAKAKLKSIQDKHLEAYLAEKNKKQESLAMSDRINGAPLEFQAESDPAEHLVSESDSSDYNSSGEFTATDESELTNTESPFAMLQNVQTIDEGNYSDQDDQAADAVNPYGQPYNKNDKSQDDQAVNAVNPYGQPYNKEKSQDDQTAAAINPNGELHKSSENQSVYGKARNITPEEKNTQESPIASSWKKGKYPRSDFFSKKPETNEKKGKEEENTMHFKRK